MKKLLLPLMLTCAVYGSAWAQTAAKHDAGQEAAAAAAVASKLFEAMRAKDAEAIRALFMPEGQLVAKGSTGGESSGR